MDGRLWKSSGSRSFAFAVQPVCSCIENHLGLNLARCIISIFFFFSLVVKSQQYDTDQSSRYDLSPAG